MKVITLVKKINVFTLNDNTFIACSSVYAIGIPFSQFMEPRKLIPTKIAAYTDMTPYSPGEYSFIITGKRIML